MSDLARAVLEEPVGDQVALERYVRHAERFGVELVFETAAGLGRATADLTGAELVDLARRLRTISAHFDPGGPDKLVGLAGVEIRAAYLERVGPVLDALRTPTPTRAGRCCEWCGKAIAGRRDRRTCSGAHREALRRAGGVGPFTPRDVTPTNVSGRSITPDESVTPRAHEQGRFELRNRGGGDFREVPVDNAAGLRSPA
jgi:hypothetical protein